MTVPPLRERREDIPLLARYFTQKYSQRMNRKIEVIPSDAMEALTNYDWPGNIRELQNIMERSVLLSNGPELHVTLPEISGAPAAFVPCGRASQFPKADERAEILQALKEANGQVAGPEGAAARLGLKRTTLQSRMKKYDIARQYVSKSAEGRKPSLVSFSFLRRPKVRA